MAPAAASVVVAAVASVAATSVAEGVSVAATSVAAAASVVVTCPPRPPLPRLPPPTLPESASVFVVAIERTSAADDSIAGGAEGA